MVHSTGSKRVFTVPIQRHPPKNFDERWQARSIRGAPIGPHMEKEFVEAYKKSLPEIHEAKHPRIHRFNDIFGFAEVWWTRGTEFVIWYYFRGDRRTKVGKIIAQRHVYPISSRQFYYFCDDKAGKFMMWSTPEEKREALFDALNDVRNTAEKKCGCFVDLSHEYEIARCLDVNMMLAE